MPEDKLLEKALVREPNNVELWKKKIRAVESEERDAAVVLVRRKLGEIKFRTEREREDLWTEYVRLVRGESVFDDVFSQALASCLDKERVCLKVLELVWAEEWGLQKTLCARMEKMFRGSHRVLGAVLRAQIHHCGIKPVRKTFKKILEQNKKTSPETCRLFGELEYCCGDRERGRKWFEGEVNKKKDIECWFRYLRMEMKHGDSSDIRGLFERMLKTGFSSKKTKNILKKYLEYEKSKGDAKGVENVCLLAKEHASRFQK
ncbi:MAG: uncharacterized protein A8A55_0790 [Amphiamblys sp. WSBS2006]|nr:MAG: uncharacterized protein A8A55_0790 [Amphiamblys sp. WSBS2006]